MAKSKERYLEIGGRRIKVSNLDKVLYPASGFTKGQVIDYYIAVSDYLLPHLKDRPVTLKRYPDGVRGEFFYEKDAPAFTPDWVAKFPVPRHAGGTDICYILINDLATLVWCANLASLELHPFLHRIPDLNTPTYAVFDLDPGEGADILQCAEVALLLKALLARVDLRCFPKVSGSKGIQVYVPLNTSVSYEVTQAFARTVAQYLEREHPKLVISEMAKVARSRKVFVDWSQNADFKTTVAVYSLRAKRERPYVSMPVTWKELDKALRGRDSKWLYYPPDEALSRLKQIGDIFAPILQLRQRISSEFLTSSEAHSAQQPKAAPPETGPPRLT
jgi:bifunctional non-homologous end joining protein LigD